VLRRLQPACLSDAIQFDLMACDIALAFESALFFKATAKSHNETDGESFADRTRLKSKC
jgi:hypothetical protein